MNRDQRCPRRVRLAARGLGFALALAVAGAGASAAPEPAPGAKGGPLQVSLADHGSVTFQVPEGWVSQVQRQSPRSPPTVSFDPPSGEGFNVQITVIWKTPDVPAFDLEHLRKVVEQSRDKAAEGATIRTPGLKEVTGEAVRGWCYSAMDEHSKAEPGDWKYMTQGAAAFGDDLLLTFTILGNDPGEPEAAMALAMIRTSKYDRVPAAATGK